MEHKEGENSFLKKEEGLFNLMYRLGRASFSSPLKGAKQRETFH